MKQDHQSKHRCLKMTSAGPDGKWACSLGPLAASNEGRRLEVETDKANGWGGFSATAYFFGKKLHQEIGIPIGLIHSSLGGTVAEAWTSAPVLNIDLFPTFADAAGAKIPDNKILDGESLQALCRGEKLKRESIFWHFPGYLDEAVPRGRELDVRTGFRTRPVSVIRKGEWKLHLHHEEWLLDGGREKLATNNAVELYHLSEDIGEHENLQNTNTAKRDELLEELLG